MANDILSQIIDFISNLLNNKALLQEQQTAPQPVIVAQSKPVEEKPVIDWADPACRISNHFTVKEALYLPSWGVMHIPTESEKIEIVNLAIKMDKIREFVNCPINVHCWIRPILNNPQSP